MYICINFLKKKKERGQNEGKKTLSRTIYSAYFRQYGPALQDLLEAVKLAPNNREVRRLLVRVKEECKEETKRQREAKEEREEKEKEKKEMTPDSGVANSQPGSAEQSQAEVSEPEETGRPVASTASSQAGSSEPVVSNAVTSVQNTSRVYDSRLSSTGTEVAVTDNKTFNSNSSNSSSSVSSTHLGSGDIANGHVVQGTGAGKKDAGVPNKQVISEVGDGLLSSGERPIGRRAHTIKTPRPPSIEVANSEPVTAGVVFFNPSATDANAGQVTHARPLLSKPSNSDSRESTPESSTPGSGSGSGSGSGALNSPVHSSVRLPDVPHPHAIMANPPSVQAGLTHR